MKKFEIIEEKTQNGHFCKCEIRRDGHRIAYGNGESPEYARRCAIEDLTMSDYIDFEEWYTRRQYPAWRVWALAAALVIMVVLIVGWEMIR